MAQKVVYIDDLDGTTDDVEPFHFSVEGRAYVIDLSEANRSRIMSTLNEFIEHARRDETPPKTLKPRGRSQRKAVPEAALSQPELTDGEGGDRLAEAKAWVSDKQRSIHNPGIGRGRVAGTPGIQTRARQWAKDAGLNPPLMGRLPDEYIIQYKEASGE